MERGRREAVQVKCPRCKHTEIIYMPIQNMPRCPDCGTEMMIAELLDEGKAF